MDQTEIKNRARELVSKMTLEEKCSQLSYRSPAINHLNIPYYNWWNEALHGVARAGTATSFPQAVGMAATFDDELVGMAADVISTEGRAKYNESVKQGDRDIYKGLTFWCPNINIFRDPRWGRGHETFGEDPYLTSRLAVAYIKGIQGDGVHLKAAACAKHFAVHSGPEMGRHEFNSVVSDKDLWETYLPAFETAVKEAGVAGVMGAYNRLNGEACCASKTLLTDILREKWGFEGYVVSDCGAIADIHMHHRLTDTAEESAALAISSGCDLNCGNVYLHAEKAVMDGLLDEKAVDEACVNLMAVRLRLGMLDACEYDDITYDKVECGEHVRLAEYMSAKSMVMLKNNGILPLDKEKIRSIAVIGPNADSIDALKGNYFGTSSMNKTILQGIRDAAGDDIRVHYAVGSHLYKEHTEGGSNPHDRLSEAVTAAEYSDVVILCVGLDASIEGEEGDANNEYAAGDKKTLRLPEAQNMLIEAVVKTGKPVILCLMAGSAMDLRYADIHADAIIQAWYPGAMGGSAFASIVFGKVSPSGKLPVTFYPDTDHLPDFTDYSMEGRTYRHYQHDVLYPFGYGLNYGDVHCMNAEASVLSDNSVEVTVTLHNKGAYKTDDVVQVYVKNLESEHAPANVSLCGYMAVHGLKASETRTVTVHISRRDLEIVDNDGIRRIDGRKYILYAGTSQPDERSEALTGKKACVMNVKLKDI